MIRRDRTTRSYRTEPTFAGRTTAVVATVALLALMSCSSSDSGESTTPLEGWPMYGGSDERTFFNSTESVINRDTASRLVPLWRFQTGAVVTASPIVADIDLGEETPTSVVFIPSWDGNLYALRANSGEVVWSYTFKLHPGASFPQAASAAVADIDGVRRVFIASGMTMHSLDAADGALIWQFDAGTGCEDCDFLSERNEILSSPLVFENVVYFGMDINDFGDGKGGFYAIDARTGYLRWYFDLETAATCYADAADRITRFDGYHDDAELGLPDDFFTTRRGCDFDRTGTACGNVWSSATLDRQRRLIYTASSNCDTDDDPQTDRPPPPMPEFDEAIFALDLDGVPAWRWRPREVDNADLAFGGVPNLFHAEIGGAVRAVVGVGNKDGTYYVLDRDGINEITGEVEPYWQTKVVPGGDIGGIIASAAVGEGKVFFSTAIGTDIVMSQKPAAWALDASTGEVVWSVPDAIQSFAPTSAVSGVVFMGSIGGTIFGYDTDSGEELIRLAVSGPASSPAVIVDGRLFVGEGTGARGGSPAAIAFQTSLVPSAVSAFCVAGTDGCPEGGTCDDGNPCTIDDRDGDDKCVNAAIDDGILCQVGTFDGRCTSGVCILDAAICDDLNQCTTDRVTPGGCRFDLVDDGTPCVVRDEAGSCNRGRCEPVEP